jgi:uncharacterized protein
MLELRPSCEHCNKALPPEAQDARICSFECTFCSTCVEQVLHNVCPNCGGGFTARPIRPANNWRGGHFTGLFPPSDKVKHRPVDVDAHRTFADPIKHLPPHAR